MELHVTLSNILAYPRSLFLRIEPTFPNPWHVVSERNSHHNSRRDCLPFSFSLNSPWSIVLSPPFSEEISDFWECIGNGIMIFLFFRASHAFGSFKSCNVQWQSMLLFVTFLKIVIYCWEKYIDLIYKFQQST